MAITGYERQHNRITCLAVEPNRFRAGMYKNRSSKKMYAALREWNTSANTIEKLEPKVTKSVHNPECALHSSVNGRSWPSK